MSSASHLSDEWNWQVQGEPERHQRNSSMVGNYGWVELMRPAVRG
jgi:hypothetical protein